MDTIIKNYELLKQIITPAQKKKNLAVDTSRLEKIIRTEIPQVVAKKGPGNFPELYFEFEKVYSQFQDFLLYDKLIGKNIVALGGGFSSGKSSFLNTLLEQRILPANIDPSTSVPTYVVQGMKDNAWGINVFDVKFPLAVSDIRSIAHGFGADEAEDGKEESEITLGHLVQSLFLEIPSFEYPHLAVLDTPGYSKPDTDEYSAKTDERIARAQLNSSDAILWFIPADAGTISTDDITFLKSLDANIPKLIVLAKADKAPDQAAVDHLKGKIRSVLELENIRIEGIEAFSRRKTAPFDFKRIAAYLRKLDGGKKQADFARRFKQLFLACQIYYDEEIHKNNVRLSHLNKVLTLSGDMPEINDWLSALTGEFRKELDELKEAREKLHTLQMEFFTEIKYAADVVGIAMPEPSEIELRQDEITDPASLTRNLAQKQAKDAAPLRKLLLDRMEKIESAVQEAAGGPYLKDSLYDLLKKEMGNRKGDQ